MMAAEPFHVPASDEPATTTQADIGAALDFLSKYRPGGPYILTAIRPDPFRIRTLTFDLCERDLLADWLEDKNGAWNVYFHVNPTLTHMNKKAGREDIATLTHLHVDIDPRAGETDFEAEKARALKRLAAYAIQPTWVIDSGGGIQAFWQLEEPFLINGEVEKYEHAKRYNLQLELDLDGDNCHNVDRIMRLPGLLNVPDEKKIKKGRKVALARVLQHNPGNVYPLSRFTLAPDNNNARHDGRRPKVEISGNVQRLAHVHELPENVPSGIKVLIVQGKDPDDPTKYKSRSEALFAVVCGLIRAQVPDQLVYSVITDPNFAISESVRDKGSALDHYARRQIEKGHEACAGPPILHAGQPRTWAREFLSRRRPYLKHFRDEFLDWNGASYGSLEDATIRSEVYEFLENALKPAQKGGALPEPFNPITRTVNELVDALKALVHIDGSDTGPPVWLPGGEGPTPRRADCLQKRALARADRRTPERNAGVLHFKRSSAPLRSERASSCHLAQFPGRALGP
jgi:hypothetical protein